ncbi:CGNR zinc finger domain-containing protein [Candidatus Mycolicibacterium alkanivorans]|uniref:ABATE domain-containing protein n=1 Tax=Candidatus Mycolicibacterium alkanivorans TaxID=2954114 RepID=A0ABS9YYN6_9MYCO|nr:ABATE domain-containing protein [Candidatus Mycolicibacterium alkanivorans]MCI4676351.1 ABATE domain-containing protein [Candidatus Mycolicibacterium alkanivorans]
MVASSRLDRAQALGFPLADEPLAVDLADTIITTTSPHTDLLSDETRCRLWWDLQRDRVPDGAPAPPLAPTVQLRRAVREILDGHVAGISPNRAAVNRVNEIAASVTTTRQLVHIETGWATTMTYHPVSDQQHQLALAAVADSLIDLLVSPSQTRLRRCQNPTCSMLFVATDARRKFCTQNICANRTRAARHYRRHHHS